MAENAGTIVVLGKADKELICPYNCDGGDVCVDPKTGKCSVCGRVFEIEETEITYTEPEKMEK